MSGLTIGVREGESFYVDDTRCLVAVLHDPGRMKIDVCEPAMTRRYEINSKVKTEILPGVLVQTGRPYKGEPTVVVEAASSKVILREELYERHSRR